MKNARYPRWAALCMALLISGCAVTPREVFPSPPAFGFDYDSAAATAANGRLRLAIPAMGPVFNPLSVRSDPKAALLWDWYNPVLFSYSEDGSEVRPDPDYLVSINKKDRTVVYVLNPQAKFNDGTPLAEGFPAVWAASREATFVGSDSYEKIQAITVEGATVTVTFRDSTQGWQSLFQRVMHPRAKLDSATTANAQAEFGAGPFQLSQLSKSVVDFVPNPAWWGRPPKLSAVSLRVLAESEAIDTYLRGELDAVDATERHAAARVGGSQLRKGSSVDHTVLHLNMDSEILADTDLRRALLLSIVPEEYTEFAFTGLNYQERVPGTLTSFEFEGEKFRDVLGSVSERKVGTHASGLFDQAGWHKKTDGIRYRDGVQLRLKVAVPGDGPLTEGVRELIRLQLQNVGAVAQIISVPRSDLAQLLASKEWDMIVRPLVGEPDGEAYLCAWYCSTGRLAASRGVDDKLRNGYGSGAERLALSQYAVQPLWNGPRWVAVRPGLVNVGPSGFATPPKSAIGWK